MRGQAYSHTPRLGNHHESRSNPGRRSRRQAPGRSVSHSYSSYTTIAAAMRDGLRPPDQLDAIHVETPVEEFVLNKLKTGTDIVLTGNPGDGKTHLIMRLAPRLRALGVHFEPDATAAESYDSIIQSWKAARKAKKPFCLAINEWPLLELLHGFEETFAPLKEVRRQVDAAIVYGDEIAESASVVVVDLNQRSVVDRGIIDILIGTLINERFYPECVACPARETCDVPRVSQWAEAKSAPRTTLSTFGNGREAWSSRNNARPAGPDCVSDCRWSIMPSIDRGRRGDTLFLGGILRE